MKATYVEINGKGQEIFKDPKTDNGTKKSAKGLLRVIKKGSKYVLLDQQGPEGEKGGELRTVFFNGELFTESFEEIKERLSNIFNTKD
jgi:nicotinamide phosphoribosyltransferase